MSPPTASPPDNIKPNCTAVEVIWYLYKFIHGATLPGNVLDEYNPHHLKPENLPGNSLFLLDYNMLIVYNPWQFILFGISQNLTRILYVFRLKLFTSPLPKFYHLTAKITVLGIFLSPLCLLILVIKSQILEPAKAPYKCYCMNMLSSGKIFLKYISETESQAFEVKCCG